MDVKIGWNRIPSGTTGSFTRFTRSRAWITSLPQKLLWADEFTTFPYKLFSWQAPDGSRLLTYFPHDYAGGIDAESLAKDLSIRMPSIYGPELKDEPEMMHLYDVGDHGGPTANDLDQKSAGMRVPTWNGELTFNIIAVS